LQKDTYDKTGKIQLSVEEQLRQSFGRGNDACCCQSCQCSGNTHPVQDCLAFVSKSLHTFKDIIHKPLGAWVTGNFRDAGIVPSTMANATLSEQITVRQSPIEQSHTAGFDVSKPLRLLKALCLTALLVPLTCMLTCCQSAPLRLTCSADRSACRSPQGADSIC